MKNKDIKTLMPELNWTEWQTKPNFWKKTKHSFIDAGLILVLTVIVFITVAFILG